MAEHPNAAVVRRLGEAFESGDMATVAAIGDEVIADDVVWHEIGRAEPRRGKSQLRAGMGGADYVISGTTHDIIANDDHVVLLAEATATRGGKTLQYRVAEIYHVRDGKITERWAFSDDTAAIAAFFA
jgi:ketosteroid isomerase-like protein